MKLLITGASGLVGNALVERLVEEGHHDFVFLTRNRESFKFTHELPYEVYEWGDDYQVPEQALTEVSGIIHLSGENVAAGRWNKRRRKAIFDSRIESTRALVEACRKLNSPPKFFISASAVGFYGDRGKDQLFEQEPPGSDYLAHVCHQWEQVLLTLEGHSTRLVCLRLGVVLAKQGGALQKMLPAFSLGIGGRLGSGKHYMSWIHLHDLISIFMFAIEKESIQGVYNAVAPEQVTNGQFTKCLAAVIKRPAIFPVPAFVLKFLLGEMSAILLTSQRSSARKLELAGFKFQFDKLNHALKDLLYDRMHGLARLHTWQWVNSPREKVFSFFTEVKNLGEITPAAYAFKVLEKTTPNIQKGTFIDYRLKIRGFPIVWRSEIDLWQPEHSFRDIQLKGPYKKWEHLHTFKTIKGGTLIQDNICYVVPGGFIGKLLIGWLFAKDLKSVFSYRKKKLKEIF